MSFCTKGLPGVAESTVSKSEAKPSPSREKMPEGRMRGGSKRHFRDTPWSFPKPFQFFEARHDSRTVKPGCLDFWLIHGLSFCAEAVLIVPFVAGYFNELVSSSTLTPPPCHSARRVYPELQNPLLQKAKQNLLPWGRRCPKGGWGGNWEPTRKPFTPPQPKHSLYWKIMVTESITC